MASAAFESSVSTETSNVGKTAEPDRGPASGASGATWQWVLVIVAVDSRILDADIVQSHWKSKPCDCPSRQMLQKAAAKYDTLASRHAE